MKNCLPNIAITGANGQLGHALREHAMLKQFHSTFYARSELDIRDAQKIDEMIQITKPDVIINAAAFTAVDKAETEMLASIETNYSGTKNLAIACQKHQIPLVHVSTDYIFDGKKTTPYDENDTPNPINYYGKSKYFSELAVREYCEHYLILRVSGVFSEHGNNFLKTILRLAQEKKQLNVVSDQITCPTYAGDIASALLTMVSQLQTKTTSGTYHFCSRAAVSWYQFAKTIIEEAKSIKPLLVEEVNAIPTSAYKTAAQRPAYSVLACERIFERFGIVQPDWRVAVKTILMHSKDLL